LKNGLCEPTNSNAHDSMSNHTEQNYGAKRCRSWNSRIAKQCINRFPTQFSSENFSFTSIHTLYRANDVSDWNLPVVKCCKLNWWPHKEFMLLSTTKNKKP